MEKRHYLDDTREGDAVAYVDKDSLKSLFHLFVGKPDSSIQIFDGPFELDLMAVKGLNERVSGKLRNHSIEASTANAYVSFSDNMIVEFSTLEDIATYQWDRAQKTDEITLKWDFLGCSDDLTTWDSLGGTNQIQSWLLEAGNGWRGFTRRPMGEGEVFRPRRAQGQARAP